MKFDQLDLLDKSHVCYCWLNTGTGIMYANDKFGPVALENYYLQDRNTMTADSIMQVYQTVFKDGTSVLEVRTLDGSKYVRCYAYLTVQPDISLFLNYSYVNATVDNSGIPPNVSVHHDFG